VTVTADTCATDSKDLSKNPLLVFFHPPNGYLSIAACVPRRQRRRRVSRIARLRYRDQKHLKASLAAADSARNAAQAGDERLPSCIPGRRPRWSIARAGVVAAIDLTGRRDQPTEGAKMINARVAGGSATRDELAPFPARDAPRSRENPTKGCARDAEDAAEVRNSPPAEVPHPHQGRVDASRSNI
jgi:hypothetical protein